MPRKPTKPPRRQARQHRSQETVRIILDAAAQVLLGEGYARATTNRITEAAGVSIGTLYQYFGGKDGVFDALVQRYFDQVLERIRAQPLDTSLPFDVTIRALVSAGIEAQRHGPELLRALEQVPNAVFRQRLAHGKRALTAFVRGILQAYRTSLRVTDLDRAATLLVNAAEGIGYNATTESFFGELADDLTMLFVRYLMDQDGSRRRDGTPNSEDRSDMAYPEQGTSRAPSWRRQTTSS